MCLCLPRLLLCRAQALSPCANSDEKSKAAEPSELEKNSEPCRVIAIGNERIRCPEVIGKESEGVHTTTYNSIMKCHGDAKDSGTTVHDGNAERMEKEPEPEPTPVGGQVSIF